MTIRYTFVGRSWSDLPFGAKVRVVLAGLGALAFLALVLSLSAALFLVLAPLVLISGLVGGFFLRRAARQQAAERQAGDQTIETHYIVIDPDAPADDAARNRRLR